MSQDFQDPAEKDIEKREQGMRYTLFIMHAQGKRIVPWTCPNCGDMPHVMQSHDGRITYICMQCQCVTGISS